MTDTITPVARRAPSLTSQPEFLQGVFPFTGSGLASPAPLSPALTYTVPRDREAQLVYFRGGNSAAELVYVQVMRDGAPIRLFPIGARGDVHVPLRVVEDLDPGTLIEVWVGAPEGVAGALVVDIGLVEV